MALIQCPVCKHSISENAQSCPFCGEPMATKMQYEIDSGTVFFTVQEQDRIRLSARVEAEIQTRSKNLASEGKTIVNVNTTQPQQMQLGFTFWRCDVTITWQASLASTKYKDYIYGQAQYCFVIGKYMDAIQLFKKLNDYKDACTMISNCQTRIDAQRRMANEVATRERELQNAVGKNPAMYAFVVWAIAGLFLLIAVIGLYMVYTGGNVGGK